MADLNELHDEARAFHEAYSLNVALQEDKFNPSADSSRGFVSATGDTNPIHRKVDGFDEVISPGFLQTCAAIVLSRKALRASGLNSLDYPSSLNECEMLLPVVTGLPYMFNARFDWTHKKADVELKNSAGTLAYRLHRDFYDIPVRRLEQRGELVYEGRFAISGEDNIQSFGRLIGSDSSESNLRALAGSSSAICNAIQEGKLPQIEPGLVAMYSGAQQFYLDNPYTLRLHEGITMQLYVEDRDKFGKPSGKDDSVKLSIVGKGGDDRVLYHFNAALSFQNERLVPLMIKKALRAKK